MAADRRILADMHPDFMDHHAQAHWDTLHRLTAADPPRTPVRWRLGWALVRLGRGLAPVPTPARRVPPRAELRAPANNHVDPLTACDGLRLSHRTS